MLATISLGGLLIDFSATNVKADRLSGDVGPSAISPTRIITHPLLALSLASTSRI